MLGSGSRHMVRSCATPTEPEDGRAHPGRTAASGATSDVCLVVAVTRRNRDALEEIYQRYGAELYGLARWLCGRELSGDVLREVFLELWRKPERFDCTRSPFLTLLKIEVYGRAVERLGSDGARRGTEGTVAPPTPTERTEAAQPVLPRVACADAWRLLCSLPRPERDAVALASFDGHTYRKVATLLGHPEGTIKRRIRSGLAALRLQSSEFPADLS